MNNVVCSEPIENIMQYMDWETHLDASDDALNYTKKLNDAFFKTIGSGLLFSVVTNLTDVDFPLAPADSTIDESGQKLCEAIYNKYNIEVPEDAMVVLIHPAQLELNLKAENSDNSELEFWDTVLYYVATVYAFIQGDPLRYSRYLAAAVTFSEALPIQEEKRRIVRDGAVECFLSYLLGKNVDIKDMSTDDCDVLDAIQPGFGALLQSFSEGIVMPKPIAELQRKWSLIAQQADEIHLFGLMAKVTPQGNA